MTVYDSNQICTETKNCYYGGYLYRGEGGNECVSAEDCIRKKKGHVFPALGGCVERDPAPDGNFVERTDYVYSCKTESLEYART